MCIFSNSVPYVANTRIFARASAPGRQYLAYQMDYRSPQPVAMILPLPLRLRASEDSVQFTDLKGYPSFFTDLLRATGGAMGGGFGGGGMSGGFGGPTLRVVETGDFIASVVPTVRDFRRIDPRFAIAPQTWVQIPAYGNYGFAVFQLATATQNPKSVPPIAFEFDTRLAPQQLYFPTVHIHDGKVHANEDFDHALYYQKLPSRNGDSPQRPPRPIPNGGSGTTIGVDIARAQGLVSRDTVLYRQDMRGRFPNRDTIIDGSPV